MTLPSTGSLSFSQISNEFGTPPNKNLGAYRISQSVGSLSNIPLDNGIPQSGSISFSNFRGKKLNMVVDYHSASIQGSHRSGNYLANYNARGRYNENYVTVIGGFKSRPSNTSNTKVYINVNQVIGSEKNSGNNTRVALRTGGWESETELIILIGPNGGLYGAGGDGGRGGDADGSVYNFLTFWSGVAGGSGTSALGLDYSAKIINNGVIRRGYGGGGGGASQWPTPIYTNSMLSFSSAGGGGGAGGSGYPAGAGGAGGSSLNDPYWGHPGSSGTNGTITSNGTPGNGNNFVFYYRPWGWNKGTGGTYSKTLYSGAGGNAESPGNEETPYYCNTFFVSGSFYYPPVPYQCSPAVGSAGPAGYAIVKAANVTYTLEGNSLIGGVLNNTNPS